MRRPVFLGAVALVLTAFAAPVHADVGRFRCTFAATPPVTLELRVVSDTRVEVAYPNGARIPYGAAGTNNVQTWQSNHVPPVQYEFDASRRIAWVRVPAASPAALSADEPFNPRLRRVATAPGARPAPKLELLYAYSAACDVPP